jgi:NitT/TauT family transport system ATP-binding protein
MSALSIRNVWMEYTGQIVLERINLEIESGAFVAIVGPSGCGKTTFLRLLLGQERPTRGSIMLDGAPMPDEPGPDRGVVFQRYSVFPHLTVLGNVLLGAELAAAPLLGRLFGAPRRRAIDAARALLAEVGLAESEQKYPAQLSGGMQQRLALAQALICKPRVLLLDEPFGALDPGIRGEIHTLMRRLWHERGVTIVMVTHDLREAFFLGTRVVVLDRLRNRPEERQRYGATITQNIEVHRRRTPDAELESGRDDPARMDPTRRDDPARQN